MSVGASGIKQVKHLLIVDLQERYEHAVVASGLVSLGLLNAVVQLKDAPLGDTEVLGFRVEPVPFHRVGLSTASLAIRKDCAVVTLKSQTGHLHQSLVLSA